MDDVERIANALDLAAAALADWADVADRIAKSLDALLALEMAKVGGYAEDAVAQSLSLLAESRDVQETSSETRRPRKR